MRKIFILLLIIVLYSCQTNSNESYLSRYSLEQFMQITSSSGMRIGKNGFSVYSTWSSKTKGRKQLFKWQANTKKHIQISNFKAGISRFSLSPDGNYIVARVSGEGKELYKLWLYNTSTGKWEKLPSKSNARYINVKWHRDSKYFYFSSNEDNLRDFHIYVYNIKTKNVSKLIELKGFNLVSDSSKNGDNIIIINFLSYDENRPYIYNIKEKKLNPILWQKAKKNMFRNLFYSMDEGEIYLYTNIFSDYNTLAKYNVRTKKIIPILKELTANYEINGLRHHLNRELFSFIINEKAYNKAYITSPKSGWKVEAFEPLGEGMYEITKITENKIYFTFQNTQRPNDAYIISRTFKTGKAVNLTNSLTQGIALESFSLPKLVYYKSFDGLEIPSFLFLPANYENGAKIPFIIHAHGGPESQFRPWFNRHLQFLLSRGYGILAPNVRGSSGYGKKYMSMDNYKNRKDSVKDYYYASKWLIDKGYTNKESLGVKGGSYGGYIVMALITDYPKLFSAAVNVVGIVNFVSFLSKTKKYRQKIREREYGPLTDKEFLKSISPINKIDKIETPLLVVHGKNDPRVPVNETEQIIEAMQDSNTDIESLIFDDEGHSVKKLNNKYVYYGKMIEWFDKYLIK